ncbi:MAG: hypothetical protein JNK05_38940 [Myxococcales bacterium]|nr:hypothetical protein [Myxococcales bacterium]
MPGQKRRASRRRGWCLWFSLFVATGCGASSELRIGRGDVVVAPADAPAVTDARPGRQCPSPDRLSTARRLAWSTCNNRDTTASCVRSTDGTRVCGCGEVTSDAALCGFGLVDFDGSNAIPGRALCDSRTGICQCSVGELSCTCRSSNPSGVCAPRTGRNCCWNESLL